MATANKEIPNDPMKLLRWIGDYTHLVEDYDNNLLRLDSIDKITSDITPYIQELDVHFTRHIDRCQQR